MCAQFVHMASTLAARVGMAEGNTETETSSNRHHVFIMYIIFYIQELHARQCVNSTLWEVDIEEGMILTVHVNY